MHWFQYSCFKHLVGLLFEALLKMNWFWVARCLFRWNAWIKLNNVWWFWELANALKKHQDTMTGSVL